MDANDIIRQYEKMRSARGLYDSHWQDIADYTHPGRQFNMEYSPGEKRNRRIYETSGLYSTQRLAGALHGMLTPPHSRWFGLYIDDKKLGGTKIVRDYLQQTSELLHTIISAEESGFNSQSHEFYLDLVAFGNGVPYVYHDDKTGAIKFKTYPLSDCWFCENAEGKVDKIFRRVRLTHVNAMKVFGDKTPGKIVKEAEKEPYNTSDYLHYVYPSDDKRMGSYRSVHVHIDTKQVLNSGYYDSFPYIVTRFSKRSGEEYGFGPGGSAYPDVRMMNRIMEVTIRGAEKAVDPPLLVPNDSALGQININPSGVIRYDAMSGGSISTLDVKSRPDIGFQLLEQIRRRIQEHYYIAWIDLPNGPQMTATEVNARQMEHFRALAPQVSRLMNEFTTPLIERVFSLAQKYGYIPAPPEALKGQKIRVEYLSPMAQAQKLAEVDSILRTLQVAGAVAGFDPLVMLNFNGDEIVRDVALDINRMRSTMINDPNQVMQARAAAAQQQAQAQQAANAEAQSASFKDVAAGVKNIGQIL